MNDKSLKILGMGITVAGAVLSIAGSIVGAKNQEIQLKNEVAKAVAESVQKTESN